MSAIALRRNLLFHLLKRPLFRCSIRAATTPVLSVVRTRYDASSNRGSKMLGRQKGPPKQKAIVDEDEDGLAAQDDVEIKVEDTEYDTIANAAMNVTRKALSEQQVFIVQPYIKWGPLKKEIKPESQLQEAEALVRSLPCWVVAESLLVPLVRWEQRVIFGSGKLDELKQQIRQKVGAGKTTCVFISKSTMTRTQKQILQVIFGVPVLDRYSVVIQILRLHATTTEARLQVAMAELPYIWAQMRDLEVVPGQQGQFYVSEAQKEMLKAREKKLKNALDKVRSHRQLLRNRRRQRNFPVVAVVGYTNAGKTSLIKALTDEEALTPRDQLFATLDVTSHAGFLPCNLQVLFMDTVGFMSDIPTGLIECFIATLEDAMLADVIIHVQDIAHESWPDQKHHVEETLQQLTKDVLETDEQAVLPPIINVGNKVDLFSGSKDTLDEDYHLVSSKTKAGINDLLEELEHVLLQVTGRQKITIKVPMGGEEAAWLYKNAAVTETDADPDDSQKMLMNVVIAESVLEQFKKRFIGRKK